MKIGIITFHQAHNSGAALQTFAMQSYLRRCGHEATVINYRIDRIDRSYDATSASRKKNFNQFIRQHLSLSPRYSTLSDLQKARHPYDAVIAGSDQIWNETILGGLNSAYFCDFGALGLRRIVYGASLGSDRLSAGSRLLMQRYLQYPDFISVREASMLPLIQPLTEKTLTVVLDPTLLLDSEDYHNLATPEPVATPYIYLHYVHHSGENPALDRAAEELSQLTGLPVCKNRKGIRFAPEFPDCSDDGPKEFLGRILHARYVVSDSFHATVFSILFGKHFLTVLPVKRPERLIALLDALGLSKHRYGTKTSLTEFLSLPDYSNNLQEQLIPLRKTSEEYLHQALHTPVNPAAISYFTNSNPFLCYGCSACHRLHTHEIPRMQPDKEGFLYPQQTASAETPSGLCIYQTRGFLPATNADYSASLTPSASYLAYHNSEYECMTSYEGGVLTEFFRSILADGGAVIGHCFDSKKRTEVYRVADSEAACIPFLSFRPQEAPSDELLQLVASFDDSRPLLVLAPPCHLASLKSTLSKDRDNVILLEQYCSGVYSFVPLHAQLDRLKRITRQDIADYNLAAKHFIPSGMRIEYTKKDGSLFTEFRSHSRLFHEYSNHNLQRPSCYACTFRAHYPCVGDIALATINKERCGLSSLDSKTISYLQILSPKGNALLEQCKNKLTLLPVDTELKKRLLPPASFAQFPLTAARPANYISPSNVVTAGPVI